MTLIELRDALRKATGPDWQLDEAISQVVLCRPPSGTVGPPRFSHSLDAAVTLVPEGLWYLCCTGRVREDEPLYAVSFNLPDMTADALAEVAAAEHAANMALCFCLARVMYDLAKTEEPT